MQTFIICLLFTTSLAQLNGEFWWLSPKLDQYRKVARPKFKDLSELETGESAKTSFRDDDPHGKKFEELKADGRDDDNETKKSIQAFKFQDKSAIAFPDDKRQAMSATEVPQEKQENGNDIMPSTSDILELKLPNDTNLIWQEKQIDNTNEIKNKPFTKNVTANGNWKGTITLIQDKTPVKINPNTPADTESICTFMKKTECTRLRGVVYVKHESGRKEPYFDTQQICCVLPMRPGLESSKIYFMDEDKYCNRHKRSEKSEVSPALKQRNNLLLRKFGPQVLKTKLTTTSPIKHKVVTPDDDYVDPYWNIKGTSKSNKEKQFHQTKYEYEAEDYVEDYAVELPSPGLVGLYSDHGPPNRPSWTLPTDYNRPYGAIDSEEDVPSFGYGPTVDPRLDRRPLSNPKIKGRPVKLSTASDERNFDSESQTISYHSNPDFQVLQGFKLLNLVRNKSRVYRNGKKETTEKIYDEESNEHVLTSSLENHDYDDSLLNKNQQIYRDCGKVTKSSNRFSESDQEIGDVEKGSHPSLALLVLTKRRQSLVCYATIVHPKAAITAADCVYGRTSPGEITLIAGAWRLDEERNEGWQKRMTTVHVHPQYKPGELAHNLALLHWKRPLTLNSGVQPACLTKAHVGDDCRFFGWGGYDQAIRKQSRWQRALVVSQRTCAERVTNRKLPGDAFCASVHSKGTVTGVGGALYCSVGGRQSVAGVAVWRDLAVVLLPAQEWLLNTFTDLDLR